MLDWTTLAVAGMSLVGTLAGTFGGILVSNRLTTYRIDQLEQKVAALQQELAAQAAERAEDDDSAPWAEDAAAPIELRVPEEKAGRIHTGVVDGQKCLLIPLEEGESARINGRDAAL